MTTSLPLAQPFCTRATGGHRYLRICVEVALLLLLRAGAEGERAVVPDADQRRRVRSPLGAHRTDPVELRGGREPLEWRSTAVPSPPHRQTSGQSFLSSRSPTSFRRAHHRSVHGAVRKVGGPWLTVLLGGFTLKVNITADAALRVVPDDLHGPRRPDSVGTDVADPVSIVGCELR
jgi:hypothetical protein